MSKGRCSKMTLTLKTWYFSSVIFLLSINGSLEMRFGEIVHFSCDICAPQKTKCCMGTIIYKNLVLTTTYCANYCPFVIKQNKKIPITKKYAKHVRRRFSYPLHNEIALVYVNLNLKMSTGVKLSAVETVSLIGLKASYPVLDKMTPKMHFTVVHRCKKKYRFYGYTLCSIKNTKPSKNCPTQGTPLLFNDKLIGISGATNSKICEQEQIVFTAVGPILSWINSIIELIENLGNQSKNNKSIVKFMQEMGLRTSNNEKMDNHTFREEPKNENVSSVTAAAPSISQETRTFTVTQMTTTLGTTKMFTTPSALTSTQETTATKTTIFKIPTTISTLPTTISTPPTTTFTPPSTIFTNLTTISITPLMSELSLEVKIESNDHKEGKKAMSAMEWFNSNVRNKMKKQTYFVLTTAENSFVDLT